MLQAQPSLCDVICAYQALAHMCLREGWEMLRVGLDSVYTKFFESENEASWSWTL